MAYLEWNAMSTILCSSFSAKVYLPEMDKLFLDDVKHEKKYPALWLFHSEGGTAMDWNKTMAEKCAEQFGIFIIAPDAQHTICTNMDYGPRYEDFLATELLKIFRNNFPISEKPEENWIGGVGTGAYGAVKAALKHPGIFSGCIGLDGIYDMEEICRKAAKEKSAAIFHTEESLKAVFGDISSFAGSEHDLYALAQHCSGGRYYITGRKGSAREEESRRLAEDLNKYAVFIQTTGGIMDFSEPQILQKAVAWLVENR